MSGAYRLRAGDGIRQVNCSRFFCSNARLCWAIACRDRPCVSTLSRGSLHFANHCKQLTPAWWKSPAQKSRTNSTMCESAGNFAHTRSGHQSPGTSQKDPEMPSRGEDRVDVHCRRSAMRSTNHKVHQVVDSENWRSRNRPSNDGRYAGQATSYDVCQQMILGRARAWYKNPRWKHHPIILFISPSPSFTCCAFA